MPLVFPKRPRQKRDPLFGGKRQTWKSADGLYLIERFTEGSRAFIAILDLGLGRQRILASKRTLKAAVRACEKQETQRRRRTT